MEVAGDCLLTRVRINFMGPLLRRRPERNCLRAVLALASLLALLSLDALRHHDAHTHTEAVTAKKSLALETFMHVFPWQAAVATNQNLSGFGAGLLNGDVVAGVRIDCHAL